MIAIKLSSLRESKPHEYATRFLFGGICTAAAGVIAEHFGPTVGGLFLAFPAIFPASASLIENHEKQAKAEAGFDGTIRGRIAASIDASGTSLGCVGLIMFAVILWKGLPGHNAYAVILLAMVAWLIVSTLLWAFHRKRMFHSSKSHSSGLTSARN
jgi:Protein of unknown function (DUF3147)